MNANGFRSHLMQQFVTAARNQSRPPIAIAGASSRRRNSHQAANHVSTPTPAHQQTNDSLRHAAYLQQHVCMSMPTTTYLEEEERLGVVGVQEEEEMSTMREVDKEGGPLVLNPLESLIPPQKRHILISSPDHNHHIPQLSSSDVLRLKKSIDLIVSSALNTVKHLFSEGILFRRFLSSESIEALADIAYEVTLRRKLLLQDDPIDAEKFASKKRARWSSTPTFLVALVSNQPEQTSSSSMFDDDDDESDPFTEMPFVPPQTEEQLEEYALAYTAVQQLNGQLRHLGSKTVSGPIIRTPAFRGLVRADETDQVVALLMVGRATTNQSSTASLKSKKSMNDIILDL